MWKSPKPASWTPRSGSRDGYPFDLDAGLRYVRPKTGIDFFPYPSLCGSITGLMPKFDGFVIMTAIGKMPSGPGVGATPLNLQWQTTIPGLSKQG